MGFRFKLLLAMLALAVATTGGTLLVARQRLEAGQQRWFAAQFASQRALHQARQQSLLSGFQTKAHRFANLVRLQSLMRRWNAAQTQDQADAPAAAERLYQTAEDDLREVLNASNAEPGARLAALLRLVDSDGRIVPPPKGVEVGRLRPDREQSLGVRLAAIVRAQAGRTETLVGHLVVDTAGDQHRLLDVIFTPIVDVKEGGGLGALVLGFPSPESDRVDPAPAPASTPPRTGAPAAAGEGWGGVWLDGELFSSSLAPAERAALAGQLGEALHAADRGTGHFDAVIAGAPHRLFFAELTPGSAFPHAYQVNGFSLREALAEHRALRSQVLIYGLLALAAAALVSGLLAHGLSGPIRELVAGTREVERGNLGVHVPVRRRDELGRLAESFNQMTDGLALKEKYRSLLNLVTDAKVAEELVAGKVALGGEEREISVLFCDIRGFTALTQNMPPVEVVRMLNEHFTPLTRVVYDCHGVVDKFVGDLIMAIFGAPRSLGADARNAAQCALQMIEARRQLNTSSPYKIEVGIGVASGAALAGCMGSSDRLNYTVLGERVNLASRLCSQAARMEVVLDATTRERLGDSAVVEALPEMKLKGFSGLTQAYRLRELRPLAALALGLFCLGAQAAAGVESVLDGLDRALFVEAGNGRFRADLSGLLDLEGYYLDQRPPGMIFGNGDAFFNPRLSLFLDTRLGPHLYGLVQARFDRGFDPRAQVRDARLDEYLLRYTPFADTRLSLEAGKFATVYGQWVQRHDSWQNPFLTAPLAYENVVIVTDQTAPKSPGAFLARRLGADKKGNWLPLIWGPSYASGAAVFGSLGRWDYAVEVKNAGLSSRPYVWDATTLGWEHPTLSARLGYRPNAAWSVGASFSQGAYLLPAARSALPHGAGLGDFAQTSVGPDISFAWRHWQVWAEAIASRFEVPNVGDADVVAYFVEARYKITPRWFGALRWNQQLFDTVPNGLGGMERWDRDAWRLELATGYRFTRHLQTKLQYNYSRQNGPFQQGEQLLAGQVTIKF